MPYSLNYHGVPTPIQGTDAANKTYVDDSVVDISDMVTLSTDQSITGKKYFASRVGIGTTTPNSHSRLQVNDAFNAPDYADGLTGLVRVYQTGNDWTPTFAGRAVGDGGDDAGAFYAEAYSTSLGDNYNTIAYEGYGVGAGPGARDFVTGARLVGEAIDTAAVVTLAGVTAEVRLGYNATAATVEDASALLADTPKEYGTGTITNLYGLRIKDLAAFTSATNKYAWYYEGSYLNSAGNLVVAGTAAASNLSGTNTGDVTLGTANGLSFAGQVLSLGAASSGVAGAMTGAYATKLDGIVAGAFPAVGGAGLTLSTYTLAVGANADGSIVVNADDIQVGVINDTQHGSRGGGSTHSAVVASGASGFMTGADKAKLDGVASGANVGVVPNGAITGATKTKITYDTKGLVTSGANATTADIAASTDKNYVTDAQSTVIGNTSGTNSGDVTLAAVGASANANGASLSGQALTLQPASASFPGLLTAAGFTTISNQSGTNSGDVSIGTFGASPTAKGASISGQVVTLQPASASFPGLMTAAQFTTLSTQSGTNTGDVTIGTANGLSLSGQAISMALAGSAAIGAVDGTGAQIIGGSKAFTGFHEVYAALASGSQMRVGTTSTNDGMYLTNSGAGTFIVSGGVQWTGAAWTARATTAGIFGFSAGIYTFSYNGSLTPGNTFTQTNKISFDLSAARYTFTGETTATILSEGVTDNITAHAGGGQASATALTTGINFVVTVGTAGDSVKLYNPQSNTSPKIVIYNMHASKAIDVFGVNNTVAINGGSAGAAYSLAANTSKIFVARTQTDWRTL